MLYLSTLKAVQRKGGKVVSLAEVVNPISGADAAKVTAAYFKLVGGDEIGAKQRAEYSACLLIIDNQVRYSHDFPDLEKAAKDAEKTEELKRARERFDNVSAKLQSLRGTIEETREEFTAAQNQYVAAGGGLNDDLLRAEGEVLTNVEIQSLRRQLHELDTVAQVVAQERDEALEKVAQLEAAPVVVPDAGEIDEGTDKVPGEQKTPAPGTLNLPEGATVLD